MEFYQAPTTPDFVGRIFEIERLRHIHSLDRAQIIAVKGRRRIGKTELIEQFFRGENVLKFEGLEPRADGLGSRADMLAQIQFCLVQLAKYTGNRLYRRLSCDTWYEFFTLLDDEIAAFHDIVLYFEEIQWLACYSSELFSNMKPIFDDKWSRRPKLRVVFSGSDANFLEKQFLSESALYGREVNQISLERFDPLETLSFIRNHRKNQRVGPKEAMLALLTVGGVPGYLKRLADYASIEQGLMHESFTKDGFFTHEKTRLFVSSLASAPNYESVVQRIAQQRYVQRSDVGSTGGVLSERLERLEKAGFISSYCPLNAPKGTKLQRYQIEDSYLNFFYNFIDPKLPKIASGQYNRDPGQAIDRRAFRIHLGYAFERWCRRNALSIARILRIDQLDPVSGSFFVRGKASEDKGFQIDLMFITVNKLVFCECKFHEVAIQASIVGEMEGKIERFLNLAKHNRYRDYTIETALITSSTETPDPVGEYFDRIIHTDEFFKPVTRAH